MFSLGMRVLPLNGGCAGVGVRGVNPRRNPELGSFLRARRARLSPDGTGSRALGRRRVPGLRREEIAALAGVSPDYYTRLEQGRQPTASESVLDALARALQLSAEERLHLYTLAGEVGPGAAPTEPVGGINPRVSQVLDTLGDTPAIACGPFLDIHVANKAASFLFEDFAALPLRERNAVRWMLLSPLAPKLYQAQWEESASDLIGMLRIDVGRWPAEQRGTEIVRELTQASQLFRRLWDRHQVSTWHAEEKVLHHPDAGPLRLHNASISVNGVPDQVIYLMIPDDREAFTTALRRSLRSGEKA